MKLCWAVIQLLIWELNTLMYVRVHDSLHQWVWEDRLVWQFLNYEMNVFDADWLCVCQRRNNIQSTSGIYWACREICKRRPVSIFSCSVYVCVSSYLCRPVTGSAQRTSLALMEPQTHLAPTLTHKQIVSYSHTNTDNMALWIKLHCVFTIPCSRTVKLWVQWGPLVVKMCLLLFLVSYFFSWIPLYVLRSQMVVD